MGVKRPGHEVDHSQPYSAKVKYKWSSTALICLHGMDRDNFTFISHILLSRADFSKTAYN
jgi:hypothetical protein